MILRELDKIARLGAEQPLNLWLDEYGRLRKTILPEAELLSSRLHQTQVKNLWDGFVALLREDRPDELVLAETLVSIATMFEQSGFAEEPGTTLERFRKDAANFQKLALRIQTYAVQRDKLKGILSDEQEREHDLRLFNFEGTMYCLEYYLAMYESIKRAPTAEAKRVFFEDEDVQNVEFGGVPGLKPDFEVFSVLEKFVTLIFNDEIRDELLMAYFRARAKILDPQTSLDEAIHSLKCLIFAFIAAFRKMGIEELAKHAFTPPDRKSNRLADIRL